MQYRPDIDTALDATVGASLRPVSAGLSALFAFYGVSHLVVLPRPLAVQMALGAFATSLVFLVLYLALRRRPLPARWAHPTLAAVAGLILVTNLLFMRHIPEPQQTTNLMLLVIGAGSLFLSTRWLLGFLAATLVGWALVVAGARPAPEWVHFGFALVTASALAAIIHVVRLRVFRRLEGLRLQDEAQKAALETALTDTEQARRVVEASRGDLERAMLATQQSEERFRRTSETLNTLIAASPLAIFALDPASKVRSWNDAAERIFGWSQEEVLGRPLPLVLKGRDAAVAWMDRVLRQESLTDVELEARIRDGRWLDISFSAAPLRRGNGSADGVMAVVADITGRKKAEEDARRLIVEQAARAQAEEAQQRLAFLAGASRTLASSLDYETTLQQVANLVVPSLADCCLVEMREEDSSLCRRAVACSDAAREALARGQAGSGRPQTPWQQPGLGQKDDTGEVVSESLLAAITPDADPCEILRQQGGMACLSVPLVARGRLLGSMILLSTQAGRCYEAEDRALVEDLASRAALAVDNARLYGELQRADQRKDEFLAMLAHELRNPLAPIRNAAQILKQLGPPDPPLVRAREIIERQVIHQARLVDDLLDVSRITQGKIDLRRERLDLTALVRDTAEDRRSDLEAAGLTLSLEGVTEPVWVEGDPVRLTQVVGNLLHNAQKFTNPGGGVTVRVAIPPGGEQVAVTVADTGIGIGSELLPHVFETFAQGERTLDRSQGGLGLGLALVKGLVELHGGEVRAESAGPGRGAAFTLLLPTVAVDTTTETAAAPTSSEQAAPPHPLRILVVEDNRDAAETLRDLLELRGYTVQVAYSGPAALELGPQFQPEVLLCDLGLPEIDGYQVAKALRRDPTTTAARMIAISGYGQEEDRRRSQEAGFDRHLTKPVDFDELTALLDALLTPVP
jgi:PAS domain S-box-containing protein